jgi:hypothetical protein
MKRSMQALSRRIEAIPIPGWGVPLAFLVTAFIAYGLFFNQLGFYWDDLPISWIRYQFGTDVLRLYFATSRPVWGLLYQLTTRVLPDVPAFWQLLAVFWRWLTAVLCWLLFLKLWPGRRKLAFTISMLFLLYPGTNLQWASFLSAHFFMVLCFFLLSYLCMFWSFRPPRWLPRAWPFFILAVLFSALNVWMMEYFFFLELIRPFFIFAFLRQDSRSEGQSYWKSIRSAVLRWLPYLAVWLANVAYRRLVFTNLAYGNVLLSDLQTRPITTGLNLVETILGDLWLVSGQAWAQVFQFPRGSTAGPLTASFYVLVVLGLGVLAALLLARLNDDPTVERRRQWIWPVGLGLVAMLTAGGPYWLASLEMTLGFPANRFTISFMLGVSLLIAGLLELLPGRVRLAVAAILIALAAGRQALWADSFRRDWASQKALFWQMNWRAPGIQPDTLVFMNDGPLNYYADNSLGAALNWIYDPDSRTAPLHYVLFYPLTRLGGTLKSMEPNQPIVFTTYWVTAFYGSTSQAVAFYYQPPGCLRVLDPQIDSQNRLIPDDSMMREAATLSSSKWILPAGNSRMPDIYGPEPAHGWCYYFEKADLAAQIGDWSRVVQLGDEAFRLNDYPNDPVERFVFIEGYAHAGNWSRAEELAVQSYKVSPHYVGPLLCKLIQRMNDDLPSNDTNKSSLNELSTKFSCLP